MLFDTGPEEDVWERNVNRLRPDLSSIELIHLSHWHRDHSGKYADLAWVGMYWLIYWI
jgi:7,8-dihydropterin-6-yl-methyl-4-(beta-D-ribofuranosyl)aminobenzene 5'-phosphate synthase